MLNRWLRFTFWTLVAGAGLIGCGVAYDLISTDLPTSAATPTPHDTISVSVSRLPSVKIPVRVPHAKFRSISLHSDEVLKLSGEVGEQIDSLISRINVINEDSDHKQMYLLISSPGGSVMAGAKLISAIESSRKPVVTVCLDMCASMAAVIHQYGQTRLMLNRSVLMFHDAAIGGGLSGPLHQIRSRLDYFDSVTNKMDAEIATRAGVNLQDFLIKLHSEIWIDAEDSTRTHFNDEIVYISILGEVVPPPQQAPTEKLAKDKVTPTYSTPAIAVK